MTNVSQNKRPRVNFITYANPANAYAGIQYICEDLQRSCGDVRLFCRIPPGQASAVNAWPFSVYNVAGQWYGNTPVIRTVFYWLKICMLFLTGERNFIFHEAHFFRLITLFKKLSNKTRIVHYATELYTEVDEPAHKGILKYYRAAASAPDLVIECEENRAMYRRAEYGVTAEIRLVPNTLPAVVPQALGHSYVSTELGKTNKDNLPVLVYSGAGYLHRELDRIIDGIALAGTRVFVLLICYGPEAELAQVHQYAENVLGSGNFLFLQNISRDEIKRALGHAQAGIVYYRPSLSIGNKFAAPTKFFEYVSAGVPVVSSHNQSLCGIIDQYGLGAYTDDESSAAIGRAIDTVFSSMEPAAERKERLQHVFNAHLSFEVAAQDGLNAMRRLFSGVHQ